MAKRRLKTKVKFFFSFILVIILGVFIALSINEDFHFDSKNITKIIKPKEVWPKISKLSLLATGDGLLHNAVYLDAYDKETDSFDFSKQLSMVKDIVSKYDLAYYNQETLFGGKRTEIYKNNPNQIDGYSSYPHFNSPSEYGDAMVDVGFNLISLASNHSADCSALSKTCLNNSYEYWESKKVYFDGFNADEAKENKHNIGEINGIKFGFLNYTNTLNGLDRFVKDYPYLIDQYDEETVKKEVDALKEAGAEVIIVAMHWHKDSAEYSTTPTQANKNIAKYLSSIGVDIILGTYSHCLQPFDIIDNKTVVFYSLGNFISNQGDIISSIGYKGIVGVLASMDIIKTEYEDGTKEITIENLGADLTYTYNKNHKDYLVIPFSKMNSTYNSNYKSIYEDYVKVLTSINNNIKIAAVNE